jgi:RHS repeat-associated protein
MNSTQTKYFTSSQAYVRVRVSGSAAFSLSNMTLVGIDSDTSYRLIARGGYRYGFQNQEKDDEVKGEGNSYTTEFRQYDPRLGRWLSLDPLMAKYPEMSPYCAFNNNPIFYTDPTGLEGKPVTDVPDVSKLMGTQASTSEQVWNKRAFDLIKTNTAFKYAARNILAKATRMEKLAKEKWNLSPVTGYNVGLDFFSEETVGYSLTMNYVTSKGTKVSVGIPLYEFGYNYEGYGENETKHAALSNLDWDQITDLYTNCHAHAVDLVGHLVSPQKILNDDYNKVEKKEVGAVGYSAKNDHSLKITGKNDSGEFIYSSNWMGQNTQIGTWKELQEGQFADNGFSEMKESDFQWYVKKK